MPDVKQIDLINKKIDAAQKTVEGFEKQIQAIVKKMTSGKPDPKADAQIGKLAKQAEQAAAQVVKLKQERTKIAMKS